MPELPEVETTRRGVAPHVIGRRIARLVIYDGRLRWPVPKTLPGQVESRTIEARRSEEQVLALPARRRGAARASRHDRQSPALPARPAAATARPHRHRARRRRAASLSRSAALRRDALGAGRSAASAARSTGSRAFRRRVLGRLPACEDPRPPRVDQGHADGQPRRRRRGEHLRQRIAVPRRHPARRRRRAGFRDRGSPAWSGRSARCLPRRSPRAAARCATSSTRTASLALSSSITAFTDARDCRAASAGRPSAPPGSASAPRSIARAARRAEPALPGSKAWTALRRRTAHAVPPARHVLCLTTPPGRPPRVPVMASGTV